MKQPLFSMALLLIAMLLSSCRQNPSDIKLPSAPIDETVAVSNSDTVHAIIGEGTTMHIIELVTDNETYDVWIDDNTVCQGTLYPGNTIDAVLENRDGHLFVVSYRTQGTHSLYKEVEDITPDEALTIEE